MPDQLTFDRGLLRQPRTDDAERITAICQDPAIQRFTRVPIPYTRSDAEQFIAMTQQRWDAGRPAPFVVEVDGQLVACLGLVDIDEMDGWAEVGYWTAPEARQQGITVAAVARVCRWAFDEVGVQRLELQTATGNVGSEKVAERVGFVREGVRRSAALLRATGGMPEQRADMTVWGLLPEELG